ncbi:sulfurtransferase [Niveispirillum lacus]|uniref:Sulfurtransferase n=1 Tax=Niveispirillum lacus TaxID=1981099 RepID=A0A255YZ80_9PROT|nr:rhodanese-like domain-containing protein [Niveispirillum lacus]OYQ34553.1 sulfurtransferase [Niveispirillum lacus]
MINELSPADIHRLLNDHEILLVDVREPQEFATARIHGAMLFPLSSFDPLALPAADKVRIVFHCGSGKRSSVAVMRCQQAGLSHCEHMAGGIQAWTAERLPTVTLDPTSGGVIDRR